MCKVRDLETCEKRVAIHLIDGNKVFSEWFTDEERKGSCTQDQFTEAELTRYQQLIRENSIDINNIDHWVIQRNKDEENCVYITRHAFDRMHERNGWNKKTALRMVKKVYDIGLNPNEVEGEYKFWVKERMKSHPEDIMKFYGQMLYIFNNNVLVTVIRGKKIKFV